MDREKVIKGLEICGHRVISQENCKECPYIYDGRAKQSNCEGVLHWDALALLKEQEAVVRCKDCNECYFASNRAPHEQSWACGKHGIDVTPNWFCADGERK